MQTASNLDNEINFGDVFQQIYKACFVGNEHPFLFTLKMTDLLYEPKSLNPMLGFIIRFHTG